MSLFISYYRQTFADEPSCYGCAWNATFKRLARTIGVEEKYINTANGRILKMKTFELKKGLSNDIIVYKVGKLPHKIYLKDATDAFMLEFLTHGSDEEISKRKEMFVKFPDGFEKLSDVVETEEPEQTEVKEKKTRKKNK